MLEKGYEVHGINVTPHYSIPIELTTYIVIRMKKIFVTLLGSDESKTDVFMPPVVNIGCGEDLTIRKLAEMVRNIVGFSGDIVFDTTKPDGTPRKLLDVSRLIDANWRRKVGLRQRLELTYRDYLKNHAT